MRLTADVLLRLIPDLAARTVPCCGPLPFVQMVHAMAAAAGVPDARYGEESFDCAETSTILAAVKAARLPPPSSCAQGICGTCKTFKHAGEVTMAHAGGIPQRDIDRGFILPCVSRPLSDIVLDS